MSKAKDIFGVACATAAIGIWGFVACSDSGDEPRTRPADEVTAPVEEEVPRDPFQDEFDSAWSGMDQSTRDAYCWSLESMTPQELAAFSAEMTGGDPADWQRVADMIQQKCTEG